MTAAPFALLLCAFAQDPAPAGAPEVDFYPWRGRIANYEEDVRGLEQRDRELYEAGGPAPGAVLLAGSSTVTRWMRSGDAGPGMAPRPVVPRGYGGSRFSDFAWFADRLFAPHLTPGEPGANVAAIALFVGNDIGGGKNQTPKGAAEFVAHVLATARAQDADVPVLLISVTPTPKRFADWPEIRQFNAEMARLAADPDDNIFFLDTAAAYLNADGTPKAELFVEDRLHQNAAGYAIWAELLKTKLTEIAGPVPAAE